MNIKLSAEELQLIKESRAQAEALKNKDKNETEANRKEAEEYLKKKSKEFAIEMVRKNKVVSDFFVNHLTTKGFVLNHESESKGFTTQYRATHGKEFDAMKKKVEDRWDEVSAELDKMKASHDDPHRHYSLWDLRGELKDLVEFARGLDERFEGFTAEVRVTLTRTITTTVSTIVSNRKIRVKKNEWDDNGNLIEGYNVKPLFTLFYNDEKQGTWGKKEGVSVSCASNKYAPRDDIFSRGRYGSKHVYKVPGSMLNKMKELDEIMEWNKERAKEKEQEQNKSLRDDEYTREKFAQLVFKTSNVEDADYDNLCITLKNGVEITVDGLCSEKRDEFVLDYSSIRLPVDKATNENFSAELFAKFMEFIQTAELIKK